MLHLEPIFIPFSSIRSIFATFLFLPKTRIPTARRFFCANKGFEFPLPNGSVPRIKGRMSIGMMYLGFLILICFIRYLFNLWYKSFIRTVSSGVNFPFFLSSLISFCILITSSNSSTPTRFFCRLHNVKHDWFSDSAVPHNTRHIALYDIVFRTS